MLEKASLNLCYSCVLPGPGGGWQVRILMPEQFLCARPFPVHVRNHLFRVMLVFIVFWSVHLLDS